MGKHAYLIMAHTNFDQLKILLECLDYAENDIYVHIDAKAKFENGVLLDAVKKSKLFFVEPIEVNWGAYSQIAARLILIKKARNIGGYDFYHFISGLDLPLKSQEYIHKFFDKHIGKEFISIGGKADWCLDRVKYYYPFRDILGVRMIAGRILNKITYYFQKLLRVNRIKNLNMYFYIGEAWFSVSEKFIDYFLDNYNDIEKYFKYTNCSDELLFPTLYMMWEDKNERYVSPYKHDVFDEQRMDILRAIDWQRACPYTYTIEDYDMLMSSHCLFARKFDINKDKEIIVKIAQSIKNEDN